MVLNFGLKISTVIFISFFIGSIVFSTKSLAAGEVDSNTTSSYAYETQKDAKVAGAVDDSQTTKTPIIIFAVLLSLPVFVLLIAVFLIKDLEDSEEEFDEVYLIDSVKPVN